MTFIEADHVNVLQHTLLTQEVFDHHSIRSVQEVMISDHYIVTRNVLSL